MASLEFLDKMHGLIMPLTNALRRGIQYRGLNKTFRLYHRENLFMKVESKSKIRYPCLMNLNLVILVFFIVSSSPAFNFPLINDFHSAKVLFLIFFSDYLYQL